MSNDIERERKYLVKKKPEGLNRFTHHDIEQGYLARTSDKIEIRIRKKGRQHTLTVKSKQSNSRFEKEIPISGADYKKLKPLTDGKRLRKIRYNIPYQKYRIELDIYQQNLKGLVTAEVEFKNSKDQNSFTPPDWFDRELTGSALYSNWCLATRGLPPKRTRKKK